MRSKTSRERPTSRSGLAEWYAGVLQRQAKSGLSVAECAARAGVSAWTLYQWRRRLAAPGNGGESRPRLVEVAITRDGPGPRPEVEAEGLTLHLDRGRRIVTLPRGFDTDDLRRLIGVLESC